MGFMDELRKLARPYAEDDEDDYDDYEDDDQELCDGSCCGELPDEE